jgi:alkanesulfonate monooxygenase SsuD/methylene tetrahydromethanopterin reductase-like flavin-dependent oxidoreductase (luciferase family)
VDERPEAGQENTMTSSSLGADLGFGVFDWIDLPPGADPARVYDERLELLAEADRSPAFDLYHLAEHHGTPLGLAPSPSLFLAAAARETRRIRLVPTTFVVPLYDPLRLAQEIAMLDQLSHGRLEIGVGKGSSPHEAAMFGLTAAEAAERFEELLPVVVDALRDGVLHRPGASRAVPLHVAVRQVPHPPLWYPSSNAASIPRLGEQGFHVLFGFGFVSPPLDVVREQSRIFAASHRRARQNGGTRYGTPGVTPRFGLMRHVLVAPTDDEARALARAAFADHYANFTHLWRLHGSDRFSGDLDVDDLADEGRMLVGSPARVARQIDEAVTAGEVNHLAAAFAWGSLPHAASLRSMRLFRDEVIPALRHGGR